MKIQKQNVIACHDVFTNYPILYLVTSYEHRTHLTTCLVKHKGSKSLEYRASSESSLFDTRITLLKYSDNSLRGTNKYIRRQPIYYMIIPDHIITIFNYISIQLHNFVISCTEIRDKKITIPVLS